MTANTAPTSEEMVDHQICQQNTNEKVTQHDCGQEEEEEQGYHCGEYDEENEAGIVVPTVTYRSYERPSSVRTNTSVPSRSATTTTSDITESHRNVEGGNANEELIETC